MTQRLREKLLATCILLTLMANLLPHKGIIPRFLWEREIMTSTHYVNETNYNMTRKETNMTLEKRHMTTIEENSLTTILVLKWERGDLMRNRRNKITLTKNTLRPKNKVRRLITLSLEHGEKTHKIIGRKLPERLFLTRLFSRTESTAHTHEMKRTPKPTLKKMEAETKKSPKKAKKRKQKCEAYQIRKWRRTN